jgi:hypothetical protein
MTPTKFHKEIFDSIKISTLHKIETRGRACTTGATHVKFRIFKQEKTFQFICIYKQKNGLLTIELATENGRDENGDKIWKREIKYKNIYLDDLDEPILDVARDFIKEKLNKLEEKQNQSIEEKCISHDSKNNWYLYC